MISYQASKSRQKYSIKHIDWRAVSQDNDLQDKYVVAVHNRYQILINETSNWTTETKYSVLLSSNTKIAMNILPKKKKNANANLSIAMIYPKNYV